MKLYVVGLGPGHPDLLVLRARQALLGADLVVGAGRLLDSLPAGCTANRVEAVQAEEIVRAVRSAGCERPCAVFSGDTGFYSGAQRLLALWDDDREVLPGVGSVAYFAARLGVSWQDWRLVSAHGRRCDPAAALRLAPRVLFLTGGENSVGALCARLARAGLGDVRVAVGENLSYPEERIARGTAAEFAGSAFASLSVLLAERDAAPPRRCPGLPDAQFIRGDVPMTKQEVRAVALAKLGVRDTDVVYDVGAGTGAVSVELALAAGGGRVYAIECAPEACALIEANRRKHDVCNLELIEGLAPQAMEALPPPDAAFVGGSKGNLAEILRLLRDKNPAVRVVVSAVTLETLQQAAQSLQELGFGEPEVTQVSVSRTKKLGGYRMLQAHNPIFLVSAGGAADGQ